MFYFSYGTDLSGDAVLDFCRAHHRSVPRRTNVRPAVLPNHRIQFWRYDSFFSGGVADVTAETGKFVSGSLFEIADSSLETFAKVAGADHAATVEVNPWAGGPPVKALAFFDGRNHAPHVPPSAAYIGRLMDSAVELGLSMMWIMQLQTFAAIGSVARSSPLRLELSDGPRGELPRPERSAARFRVSRP